MSQTYLVGDDVYFQDNMGREVGFHIPAIITGVTTKKLAVLKLLYIPLGI